MLDQALESLMKYDWGQDTKVLKPIEEACVKTHGDSTERAFLESKLIRVLKTDASRDAKDYVCRKLMVIGTASSVPTLAGLLGDANLSHMARYALERIPGTEAAQALREAIGKVSGALKIGMITSLGGRRDEASISTLAGLLGDSDAAVARAAALALGAIRTPEAAQALSKASPSTTECKLAATDALLACAEAMVAAGKKSEALPLYKSLTAGNPPKHIRLAATRGMLACAGKSE